MTNMSVSTRVLMTAGLLTNCGWEELELTIGPFRIFEVTNEMVPCWLPGLTDFDCEGTIGEYRAFWGSLEVQAGVSPARSICQEGCLQTVAKIG